MTRHQFIAPVAQGLRHGLGLDLRALSLFRILFGVLILVDLMMRCVDAEAFYSDFGVLPRAPYIEGFASRFHISLHLAHGSTAWFYTLSGVAMMAAACFTLGLKTWPATLVLWVLTVSLHNRNPLIVNGGDVLLRMMLLWCLFLPCSARWSLDARREQAGPGPNSEPRVGINLAYSGGTIAATLQIALVYLATFALKSGREWWPEGTASYYALSLDAFVTPLGAYLVGFPELLRYVTLAVWTFELLGVLLLFSPWRFALLRSLAICGFVVMHLQFELTMRLGIFPWMDAIALVMLVPTSAMDRVEAMVRRMSFMPRLRAYLPNNAPISQSYIKPRWFLILSSTLALLLISLVALWNLSTLPDTPLALPANVKAVAQVLRLDQKWNMFAPFPLKEDGYFVIPGVLANQQTVDVLNLSMEPPQKTKPQLPSYTAYANARWRKYLLGLWQKSNKSHRLYFSRYLCRKWNRGAVDQAHKLRSFEIVFFRELTREPGLNPYVSEHRIWSHDCFAKPKADEAKAEATSDEWP